MEKVEKSAFIYHFYALTSMHITSRGQGHLGTLAIGHSSVVCQCSQRFSPLGQIQLNFICRL